MGAEREKGRESLPEPDAVLDWLTAETGATQGTACALLTPAITARLREMGPGQVLEVRVNDPTARDDINAWCRLSGHELLALDVEPPAVLRASIRKKQS
jgi:tRNA 2-thiouridine synthesizing protein A